MFEIEYVGFGKIISLKFVPSVEICHFQEATPPVVTVKVTLPPSHKIGVCGVMSVLS